jgi:hypothetical protein
MTCEKKSRVLLTLIVRGQTIHVFGVMDEFIDSISIQMIGQWLLDQNAIHFRVIAQGNNQFIQIFLLTCVTTSKMLHHKL